MMSTSMELIVDVSPMAFNTVADGAAATPATSGNESYQRSLFVTRKVSSGLPPPLLHYDPKRSGGLPTLKAYTPSPAAAQSGLFGRKKNKKAKAQGSAEAAETGQRSESSGQSLMSVHLKPSGIPATLQKLISKGSSVVSAFTASRSGKFAVIGFFEGSIYHWNCQVSVVFSPPLLSSPLWGVGGA